MTRPRILYLTKGGREERLAADGPSEFLYGFAELQESGAEARLLPDRALGLDRARPNRLVGLIGAAFHRLTGIPGWPLWQMFGARQALADAEMIFVTTNTFGLCLGILNRLGLLRIPVLFLAMGLVEPATPRRWRAVFRWALKGCRVVALAEPDSRILTRTLGRNVPYVPFGVDRAFWTPSDRGKGGYALSIGNDRHRDYATLIAAWQPDFPLLKIVTRLPVSAAAANVEIIHGDWNAQSLSDAEVRGLFRGADFVILPIRDTVQPSGQSAALQAMACGKAVLITDYPGLWNRELMRNGETCLLMGAPGDAGAITRSVEDALANPAALERIGLGARQVVERDLNCNRMANALRIEMEAALDCPVIDPSILPTGDMTDLL